MKDKRFSFGLPPMIHEIIKQQVGIIGNSEVEVIKNMILIYLTERRLLKIEETKKEKDER